MSQFSMHAQRDPISGEWADGYPHERDIRGWCLNCDTRGFHYKLVPKARDTPIYDRLMRARIQAKS